MINFIVWLLLGALALSQRTRQGAHLSDDEEARGEHRQRDAFGFLLYGRNESPITLK